MIQNKYNFDIYSLFKIKLILKNQTSLGFFPIISENSLEVRQAFEMNFNKFSSAKLKNNRTVKKMFLFISECKKNVFLYNFSLSRFTTAKYRVVDRRFVYPRLTEFSFNFDVDVVELSGTENAKVPLNFFVNSFNFTKHLFLRFKRTHSAIKLKPWKKTYSLLFRKISAKQFGFNSFLFSFSKKISSFFFLSNFLLLVVLHGLKYLVIPTYTYFYVFLVFNRRFQGCFLGENTGMVVFKKPGVSLFTINDGEEVTIKDTMPVKHYREFYPFSKNETQISGAVKLIADKQKGKATYFIFETRKMLNRKTKIFNLFFPKKAYRVFPNLCLADFNSAHSVTSQTFSLEKSNQTLFYNMYKVN